ncbi:MAG: methyltransferase domain-containing protein [Planctomycetota bacterium]|nr:methyltransferase domain-containing protein [Planctomycetota bacterium]
MPTSRDLAADLLLRLDRGGGRMKDSLPAARRALVDPRERALLTELAYGTLRRQGTLDAVLASFSSRPIERLNAALRIAIRLGAYQLFFLDRIPNHAAVDHAVGWASKHAGAKRAGFVNGVLRALIRGIAGPATGATESRRDVPREDGGAVRMKGDVFPDPETHAAANLGARYGMPTWSVQRWLRAFGTDRTSDILRAGIGRPPLTLRARGTTEALTAALDERGLAWELRAGAVCLRGGDEAVEPLLEEGHATVQDATSQRVVPCLALQPGQRVLDLCAAPGGKTLQAADELRQGEVVACDIDPRKIALLEALRPRMGAVNYHVKRVAPEGPLPFEPASFDAVLIDAPCTNTGVYARRVEARWRARPDDAATLAAVQGDLLDRAAGLVRPGGRLVYSTCSIEPAENEGVFEAFLARHVGWTGEVAFRTWPSADGDGGFAAVLMPPVAAP